MFYEQLLRHPLSWHEGGPRGPGTRAKFKGIKTAYFCQLKRALPKLRTNDLGHYFLLNAVSNAELGIIFKYLSRTFFMDGRLNRLGKKVDDSFVKLF